MCAAPTMVKNVFQCVSVLGITEMVRPQSQRVYAAANSFGHKLPPRGGAEYQSPWPEASTNDTIVSNMGTTMACPPAPHCRAYSAAFIA